MSHRSCLRSEAWLSAGLRSLDDDQTIDRVRRNVCFVSDRPAQKGALAIRSHLDGFRLHRGATTFGHRPRQWSQPLWLMKNWREVVIYYLPRTAAVDPAGMPGVTGVRYLAAGPV